MDILNSTYPSFETKYLKLKSKGNSMWYPTLQPQMIEDINICYNICPRIIKFLSPKGVYEARWLKFDKIFGKFGNLYKSTCYTKLDSQYLFCNPF